MFATDIFHIQMKQILFSGRKITEKKNREITVTNTNNDNKGFGLFNVNHRQMISTFNDMIERAK